MHGTLILKKMSDNRIFFCLIFFSTLFFSVSATTVVSEGNDTIRKKIPYTLPWDDMPVDLSFVYRSEKPAGKHGFLKVHEDKFIFEDGTVARFWGTCINSAQSFPSHEHSEKLAIRLAKTGLNIVRFHQMDAEWSTPNIFQYTKGENKPNTLDFDPVSLDCLDYLVYCLKKNGIYVYMDLLTYRRFKEGDGVAASDKISDSAKPYSIFNERLIELQKKFNYDLWTHINPYTGLAYKDDPVFVLCDITNENDFFTWGVTQEPYRSELETKYRKWAEKKGVTVSDQKVVFDIKDNSILPFLIECEQNYYTEMIGHLRDVGVKIPLTGSNLHGDWSRRWGHLTSQLVTDFTDSHAYWQGGSGTRNLKGYFGNMSMSGLTKNMIPDLALARVGDKPFFVSEWDNPYPNEWRAESTILMAAVGSFQGWNGFTIHTYRYSKDEDVDMIGKPITSKTIGGGPHRGGVYDTFNDPAKFGLFYHAALILRRGDVKPAGKIVAVKIGDLSTPPGIKALQLSAEQNRIEMLFPGKTSKASVTAEPGEELVNVEAGEVWSDTKEMYRNLKKRYGWVDSERTKAVYGFTGSAGTMALNNFKISVKNDFATVAVSSLTEEPVNKSTNMLLTAVGRAENTNVVYNKEHNQQIDPGHGPIQVEVIEAAIEITTDKKNLRIFSVNPQGFIIGYIPSEYKDGVLRFEIGKEYQSMYYLIQSL
jgi:hypothetical protein